MEGAPLFGQPPLLSQRADLPLPSGVVSPGTAPVVTVAAAPQHPSNVVLVQIRRDGGPAQLVRSVPEAVPFQEGAQWYRAALPTLDEGRRIDYRVELTGRGSVSPLFPPTVRG